MKKEESNEKPNALDAILKSLRKIRVFVSDVKLVICQETHERFTGYYISEDRDYFLSKLSLTSEKENGVSEILVTVLDHLPHWNHDFVINETVKMNCVRCRMDTEYTTEPCYGIIITANSLRNTKSAFEHFSFEHLLKVIMKSLQRPCNKEGCEKQSHVQRLIKKLPSVFTIALGWEKNETEEEIHETVSVLATEIDISKIYQYDGHCQDTKYYLVSMVCSHGDQYSCVALENRTWVRYFGNEQEVIGDWGSVLSMFRKLNMRPEIVFFENAVKREKIVKTQRDTKSAVERKLAEQYWFYGG